MTAGNGKTPRNGATLERADLDELKARVDLAETIRQSGVELKKTGRNLMARCPFHEGDQQPSLSVKGQLWKCFGCNAAGDVLSYLERKEKLSFPQAVARLRQLAGESLPATAPEPPRPVRPDLLQRVVQLYAQRLRESPEAQQYLAERGLADPELWAAFQLGYSDGQVLDQLELSDDLRLQLEAVGVLNERGREHFSGCLVVPLAHPDQGWVNLYGRKIDPRAKVKHLYLPGPKRGVLNVQALQGAGEVYLAESVLDALSVWQAGHRDVTCLYGVSGLPADLAELLGRYAVREVRFCLDGDGPGQEATLRLAQVLAERGIASRSVRLPDGLDPNQVLSEQGPTALRQLLDALQEPAADPPPPVYGEREERAAGFTLRFDDLLYHVTPVGPFGGRRRVNLDVRRGDRAFMNRVDLVLHRSRADMVAQLHARLQVPREELERHFLRLIDETDRWVDEQAQVPAKKSESPSLQMSAEEREEGLAFLKSPHLVATILEEMRALGYVGEEKGKLLAYLIGVSRKLEKPLSGILISQSGTGKSGLADVVETLTPPEDVMQFSRITAQALYWMDAQALVHKLLLLEERQGGLDADYSLRVLQSRRKLSLAAPVKDPETGEWRTLTREVDGPIAFLETTTSSRINHENATRCFEIGLDESEAQTGRILETQRGTRTPSRRTCPARQEAIVRRHHNAQRLLEGVLVMIPYVDRLRFPTRWLRARRDHERFLSLIETVAFLHQFQRQSGQLEDGTRYVEATPYDYRIAFHLAREVLASTFHELSREARDLQLAIQEMLLAEAQGDMQQVKSLLFTRKDVRDHVPWPYHRIKDTLAELLEMDYLEAATAGSQGRTYQYRVAAFVDANQTLVSARDLTTPEELERAFR